VASGLANISVDIFQRSSFYYSGVDLQSQEAFELAAKGPVRPDKNGPTLVRAFLLGAVIFYSLFPQEVV
jgi:hypothetical protein